LADSFRFSLAFQAFKKIKNPKKTENLVWKTKKNKKNKKKQKLSAPNKKKTKHYAVVCHDTNKVHLYT
jgi:hypothetical protein